MDTPRFYEVKPQDSARIRGVVKLLEEHVTFKDLTLSQLDLAKSMVQFLRELAPLLDSASTKQPSLSDISTKELKAELSKRGYGTHKVSEES